jgi:LPXTG-motif cell wall-anchored protein
VRARRDDALAQARAVGEQAKTMIVEKAPALRSAARQPLVAAGAAVLLLLLVLRRKRRNR